MSDPEEIARLGVKFSAGLPLSDDEKALLEALFEPCDYLQDLTFKPVVDDPENT